jgi:hypothetical protein
VLERSVTECVFFLQDWTISDFINFEFDRFTTGRACVGFATG